MFKTLFYLFTLFNLPFRLRSELSRKGLGGMLGGFMFFLSFTLSAAPELSQHYAYRYFSTRDGLAQMQVMCMFQDSDGYMWFGTKGGVSRWDGKSFKNYTPEDGLPFGEIRNVCEWGTRKIFFSSRAMIVLNENDSISIFQLPENMFYATLTQLSLPIDNENIFVFGITDEKNNTETGKRFNFRFNIVSKKFTRLTNFDRKVTCVISKNIVCSDGVYCWTGKKFIKKYKFPFLVNNVAFDKSFENVALEQIKSRCFRLYSLKNKLFVPKDSVRIYDSPHRCTWLPDGTFLSLTVQGYSFIPSKQALLIDKTFFPNFSYVDKENNLWIGTENGLYNFFNLNIKEYNFNLGEPDNIWSIVEDNAGTMWLGSYGNGLITLNKQRIIRKIDFKDKFSGVRKVSADQMYMGSTTYKNNVYMSNALGVMSFVNSKFSTYSNTPACLYAYYDLITNKIMYSGADTLTNKRGLYIGMGANKKFYPFEKGFPICIIRDANGVLRVGAFRGSGRLKNGKLEVDSAKRDYASVVCMALDNRKRLWKATEKGIYVELPGGREFRLSPLQLTGSYTSMAIYKNKYLVVGGTVGFAIVDISNPTNYINPEVINIGYEGGFTGLESGQNGICVDSKGSVWLATALNVLRFYPEEIVKNYTRYTPKIRINSISFSADNTNWQSHFFSQGAAKIDYENKFFRIDYIANSISAPKSLRFRYRLLGLSDKWSEPVYTKSVNYTNIGFGKYCFEVQCSMNGMDWSPVVQSPAIEITVPFYMRPISYFTYLLLIIVFSILIARNLIRRKQALQLKELTRKKLENELQLKSLRSKIIPHFTKNVLSAIGHFAMTEKIKAGHYIAVFYKFSEKTLTYSDKSYIALNEEIEYTKLYLELEKMRFEDKVFNFEIVISDEINPKMLVPAMALHTYCDNAIRHGLINKPDKGWQLIVSVEKEIDAVKITVTDNGIGRKNAAQLGTQGAGQGLSLIDQQLDFYNTYNDKKITQQIYDLTDLVGNAIGTKVELYVPDNFRFVN